MGAITEMFRRRWSGEGGAAGARELSRDEVLGLPRWRRGWSLRVEAGLVLVTREGDPEDYVLEPGSELHVPGSGRVVAWALDVSRIVVAEATAPAAAAVAVEPAVLVRG